MADETTKTTAAEAPDAPRLDAYGQPIEHNVEYIQSLDDDPLAAQGSDVIDGYQYGWSGGPTEADRAHHADEVERTGGKWLPKDRDVRFAMLPVGGPEGGRIYYRDPETAAELQRQRREVSIKGRAHALRDLAEPRRPNAPGADDPSHFHVHPETGIHESRETVRVSDDEPRPRAAGRRKVFQVGANLT